MCTFCPRDAGGGRHFFVGAESQLCFLLLPFLCAAGLVCMDMPDDCTARLVDAGGNEVDALNTGGCFFCCQVFLLPGLRRACVNGCAPPCLHPASALKARGSRSARLARCPAAAPPWLCTHWGPVRHPGADGSAAVALEVISGDGELHQRIKRNHVSPAPPPLCMRCPVAGGLQRGGGPRGVPSASFPSLPSLPPRATAGWNFLPDLPAQQVGGSQEEGGGGGGSQAARRRRPAAGSGGGRAAVGWRALGSLPLDAAVAAPNRSDCPNALS